MTTSTKMTGASGTIKPYLIADVSFQVTAWEVIIENFISRQKNSYITLGGRMTVEPAFGNLKSWERESGTFLAQLVKLDGSAINLNIGINSSALKNGLWEFDFQGRYEP